MNKLMPLKEASAYVGLAESTLNRYRSKGGGPRYVRVGRRRIGYRREDLDEWLHKNTHSSTSEYPDRSSVPDGSGEGDGA